MTRFFSRVFSRAPIVPPEMLAGPIRGDLLGAEQLAERARVVARGERLREARASGRSAPLLERLRETRHILDVAHRRLMKAAQQDGAVGPAGDWFLDNYFVVQEHIQEVRASLPRGYYRELPELSTGPLAGYPRVYELAITLISHTEGRIDVDNVDLVVAAFQEVAPLRVGELWAIPAMLRLGLIESVRRMTLRTVQRLDEVERADQMAARLVDASNAGPDELRLAVADLQDTDASLHPIFISRFLQRLRLARGSFAPLAWLERWIADESMSGEEASTLSVQRLAMTQMVMANSITSLRSIARMDWRSFVERQSVLEAALQRDPTQHYPRMTFATRDQYRHVVERIAARTHTDEAAVAEAALTLARRGSKSDEVPHDPVRSHVGYYLLDHGLEELETLTGYRPRLRETVHRWIRRHPNVVFVGGVLTGTLLTMAAFLLSGGPEASPAWLAVLLLTLIPSSEVSISVVNRLVVAFLPPALLPKLELRETGVPPELRTAVVIPTLFASVDGVTDSLETIEVQYLANRQAHLHFAILSDFTDAPAEREEDDDAILRAAVDGVRALNARYAPESDDAFYLFHRDRRWNPAQGVWMGWERKRGKLAQFNRFLRGGAENAFATIVGNVEPLRGVRYVVTLDADTVLPPGAAPLLVGALAHPLNRAIYDEARGRVVRGYGILQPRVGVSLPSANRSRFAGIQSGYPGIDPYTTAVSDVYQDLYHEGSFTGKGIYDVDAFERATRGRFPENRLLSHDLIEGSYARAGLVTDITVYDDYPASYFTYTRRKHRWLRGDWQLLQWLTSRVPGPDGFEPNRLSLLSRWKLFDNLRRSVVEIALVALLAAGWWVLPGSPLRWNVLALVALAAPWMIALLIDALRPPLDKSWQSYYAGVGRDLLTSTAQLLLTVAFLPHQAWISLDGIARTLWRMTVSHRYLLEWQTAHHVERQQRGDSRVAWGDMWPVSAAALALLVTVGRETPAIAPLFLLWASSPLLARTLSRSAVRRDHKLSEKERAAALRYAELQWRYYERFVSESTHWLAPDNVQEDPEPVVAMRTSPTNIGLQLLAIVSAHDLGFITLDDMARQLELVMRSMEQLRRFRGHLFNWYDLHDLHVLDPPYVSTVDSGNLAGHLIALRQALLALAGTTPDTPELTTQLHALAGRADDFAGEMDFGFLYDRRRELFAIGYHLTSHSLDDSYYDLLASEARLASFLAVARDDVPVEHWFHLGRTLTRSARSTALVSWSGSMFEYLMPTLVMRSYPFTLLDQTYHSAVERQIAYGASHGVPWGTSESAYNLRDRHLIYQYRAFGVPDLALERRIGNDLVVAPYATALALAVAPERALANLSRLEAKGALGTYGFYDALDYSRPDPGSRYAIVRNYMAHHVGMTMVALTNALRARVWQRRFHSDPLVRSAELLLHERIPRRMLLQEPRPLRHLQVLPDPALERPVVREIDTVDTQEPHVALLGRLPYTIMISHCGGGYSRYEDLAVTRWCADGTTDQTGQFCYIRDVQSGRVWSAAHQPVCAPADWYQARLATDRVTFHRRDDGIETRTEVVVTPVDGAETRRVTVSNETESVRELELTSYGEIVIASHEADRQHPAFSNLFVQTEWHAWCSALTATRRPRSATERTLWCAHVVDAGGSERIGKPSYESDRALFVGRGRSTRDPVALEAIGRLTGTTGAVLDPVFAIRVRVRLAPGKSASVAFTTIVAESAERVFKLADRYHDPSTAQRALDLAWASTQVELRELGVSPSQAAVFQELAGHLLYGNAALRVSEPELRRNRGGQPLLWEQGISGDWPILLATIESTDGLPTITELFAAHHYWRRRGMRVDLVILNEHPSGYFQPLHERISAAMFGSSDSAIGEQPGGVFIRRRDQLAPGILEMIRATARVVMVCDGRTLGMMSEEWRGPTERDDETPAPPVRARDTGQRLADRIAEVRYLLKPGSRPITPARSPRITALASGNGSNQQLQSTNTSLLFDNGTGGLTSDGDYMVRVRGDVLPPAPWANVIANARGGCIVTERGAGCTWAGNAQFYRLTPWRNDPVSDEPGDALYLRDEESGELWSPTPGPVQNDDAYSVTHSAGASTFEHHRGGITTHLTMGMATDDPVRIAILSVTNHDARARRLSLTWYVEWTVGVVREETLHQVVASFDVANQVVSAVNAFNPAFAHMRAFAALSEPLTSFTGDRQEFIGRNGSLADPAALREHQPLSGTMLAGIDPCAALQCALSLEPGETRQVVALLGGTQSDEETFVMHEAYRTVPRAQAALERSRNEWSRRLSTITVRTPSPSFDAMINRWALYQSLSCRVWGRAAVYQSSGAFGFRDQLQDVMACLYAEPAVAREHILRAAGRQFVEGDVQHWWHPPDGRGVRTRISDDLAWLPFVVEHFVRVTGDATILDESAGFISMPVLADDQHERYDLPQPSNQTATVYEHCVLAIKRATTEGPRGLPLIGGGDWNDGMNRVGVGGKGESVWLAWFLIATLRSFAWLASQRNDDHTASEMRQRADRYAAAVEQHGWDGEWYRRAYFDDGTPLGSASNEECRIDSIAQSWSVLSGAGDPDRQRMAMQSLEKYLVREDARLIALLTPPFDKAATDPGYIRGYVPGVRENGAQYTHAAIWAVQATALLGNVDRAFELFQMLNPLMHTRDAIEVQTYKVEPYVVAADVYTAAGHVGRGGWTWYTGSASWLYRAGLETILGFSRTGNTLRITPRVPNAWNEYVIEYRHGSSTYAITVQRVEETAEATVTVDGVHRPGGDIALVDDGARHEVLVRLAVAAEQRSVGQPA